MPDDPRRGLAGRRFRPTLWASVFTLAGLALLIGLGTWQLQRLQWKDALIAERQARSTAEAVPLPADLSDPASLDFTRVVLTGRFLHDRELYLGSRTLNGAVGYHVVTPFLLNDGRTILVDRGWVPPDRRDPATRAAGQIEGEIRREALLRRGGWRGWSALRPNNKPAGNLWLWLDLPAMARAAGLGEPVTTVYAQALPAGRADALPIASPTQVDLRNEHLQYAITWYALALALLVIFLIYSTRRGGGADRQV